MPKTGQRLTLLATLTLFAAGAVVPTAAAQDVDAVEDALAVAGVLTDGSARADVSADPVAGAVEVGPALVIESASLEGAPDPVASGTTAVSSALPATDGVIQETPDGVRLMTVLHDASAPQRFDYEFPGALLIAQSDGTVYVEAGDTTAIIAPAWALDARGNPVPTHYEVSGSTLTQVVEHAGAEYPVVADPWITLGWGWYLNFNKTDVKRIAPYAWTGQFYTLACIAIPNVYVAGACAIAVNQHMSGLATTFVNAAAANRCVQMHFATTGYTLLGYRSFSC